MNDSQEHSRPLLWDAADMMRLPTDTILEIVQSDYKNGKKERAVSLLKALPPKIQEHVSGYKFNNFKNKVVRNNDFDFLNQLFSVEWLKKFKDSGGIAMAVVTKNKEMLDYLIKSSSTIDSMSLYEVSKIDANFKIISQYRLGIDSDYKELPAEHLAIITKDKEALFKIIDYRQKSSKKSAQDFELELFEDNQKTVRQVGNRAQERRSLDVFDLALEVEANEIIKELLNRYEDRLMPRFKNLKRPEDWSKHIRLLDEKQQEKVWDIIEIDHDYTLAPAWENGRFREMLLKEHPKKYVQYLKNEKLSKLLSREMIESDFYLGLKQSESLGAVKTLLDGSPDLIKSTRLIYPGEGRRVKRNVGPLLYALTYNQPEAVDLLNQTQIDIKTQKKQTSAYEREAESIKEFEKKHWLTYIYEKRWASDELSAEDGKRSIKSLLDRIRLKESISNMTASKIEKPAMKAVL